MPQFLLYAKHANEQKAYKLDIRTVNDYIARIFGREQSRDSNNKKPVDAIDCKIMQEDKINNPFNIRDARNLLIAKTGRKSFTMDEIIKEINLLKPSTEYRMIEPDTKR